MATAFQYITSVEGLLKLAHIIFGFIIVGCVIPGYETDYNFEVAFFVAAIGCLVVSLVTYPIVVATARLPRNRALKIVDSFLHIIMGIVLIVTSSMMLSSAVKNKRENDFGDPVKNPKFDKKVSAGSFGLINGILYLFAAILIIRGSQEDEVSFNGRTYVKPT